MNKISNQINNSYKYPYNKWCTVPKLIKQWIVYMSTTFDGFCSYKCISILNVFVQYEIIIRKKKPKQTFKTQLKKTKKQNLLKDICDDILSNICWYWRIQKFDRRMYHEPEPNTHSPLNRFSRPWENFVNDNLIKTKHIFFAKVHWHCNKINQLYKHFLKFVERILFKVFFILFNRSEKHDSNTLKYYRTEGKYSLCTFI